MPKLNIQEYLAKHQLEFPGDKVISNLPLRTDAISVVSDPENWNCYPDNVVRIWLSSFIHLGNCIITVGIGDFANPTLCSKNFDSLDDACSFIANRPDEISKKWLRKQGFRFLRKPPSKAVRIH